MHQINFLEEEFTVASVRIETQELPVFVATNDACAKNCGRPNKRPLELFIAVRFAEQHNKILIDVSIPIHWIGELKLQSIVLRAHYNSKNQRVMPVDVFDFHLGTLTLWLCREHRRLAGVSRNQPLVS